MSDDSIRQSSAQFLQQSLSASAAGGASGSKLGEEVEQAIFSRHGGDAGNEYRQQVREIGLTLKKDNPQLAQDLVQGRVDAAQIAGMGREELKSDARREADEELQQRNLQSSLGTTEAGEGVGAVPLEASAEGVSLERDRRMDKVLAETGEDTGLNEQLVDPEGEFKARAQPKVGQAMQGVEFDTGDAL